MSNRTLQLTDKLYQYLLDVSLREHPVLQELRVVTHTMPGSQMQIAPEQGQFLAWLISLMNAKKVLELGTFTGYSALVMALAMPADGHLTTCDVDPRPVEVAKEYWAKAGQGDRITSVLKPGLDFLQGLLNDGVNDIDFVFIDADKRNYSEYVKRAFELLRVGGVIAIDNVLWDGEVAELGNQDPTTVAIREMNDMLLSMETVDLSLLPLADGLTLLRKRG